MRLRQSILISADPAALWPLLADPAQQANWNPKVISVDRDRSGPVQLGEQFLMTYRMSGRDHPMRVEVTTSQPPQRLVFLHRTEGLSTERSIEEAYDLLPQNNGVKVIQTIDLSRAGIPWPFRLLIWFINRFGHSTEQPYLERLKHLAEHPARRAREAREAREARDARGAREQ